MKNKLLRKGLTIAIIVSLVGVCIVSNAEVRYKNIVSQTINNEWFDGDFQGLGKF